MFLDFCFYFSFICEKEWNWREREITLPQKQLLNNNLGPQIPVEYDGGYIIVNGVADFKITKFWV
jgi:hypothetical protein